MERGGTLSPGVADTEMLGAAPLLALPAKGEEEAAVVVADAAPLEDVAFAELTWTPEGWCCGCAFLPGAAAAAAPALSPAVAARLMVLSLLFCA